MTKSKYRENKKIDDSFDADFFKNKIDSGYAEIKKMLGIEINGGGFLINNESFIKEKLLQFASIGYDRYRNLFRDHLINVQTNSEPVLQFNLSGSYIDRFESINQAERIIGVANGSISSAIKRNGTSGGFYWILEKDYKPKNSGS